MSATEEWWEPPRTPSGQVHIVQVARDMSAYARFVYGYLLDTATIMEEIRVELPPRGLLMDKHLELAERLSEVSRTWRHLDDILLTVATLVEAEKRRRDG